MGKNKELIFGKEHKEFLRLWHSYHAKYKIPYTHDDRDDFFLKLTLIFDEGELAQCQDCSGYCLYLKQEIKKLKGGI